MQAEKITALYARYSAEEEIGGESDSIVHQRAILSDFAAEKGYTNCRFYVDDGVSGTTFERDGFKRMTRDIEDGLIGTVIVKDLSRLGRNYLLAGQYIEVFFPDNNVRFISISDSVDTATTSMDFLPFHNLMNEWYARDISRKMKAMLKNKGNSGKRLANNVPYGYKKGEDGNWAIDEFPAEIVRKVFGLYLDGFSAKAIARVLYEEKVEIPAVCKRVKNADYDHPYSWASVTVTAMLKRQEYCGDTVNFRTEKKSYKSKKVIRYGKENYRIFPDTHPAIIDRETFEKVAEMYAKNRRQIERTNVRPLFYGKLVCADCKSNMYASRRNISCDTVYLCGSYRKIGSGCTSHYVRESDLREQVLKCIQALFWEAKSDMKAFKRKIERTLDLQESEQEKALNIQLEETQKRIGEIDLFIRNLYEDKVQGNITQEIFANLSANYAEEKSQLNNQITELLKGMAEQKHRSQKINNLYAAVEKYEQIDELTPEILVDFIDRVEVHEREDYPVRHRYFPRKIEVFFIGIGRFLG